MNGKMQALIQCYGNTRSNMLTAAVNTHLEQMGLKGAVDVVTGGLARVVEGMYKRAGTSEISLPQSVVDGGYEINQLFGDNLRKARRLVATSERLANANVVLAADAELIGADNKLVRPEDINITEVLRYSDHEAPVWKYDLDDASPRGALDIIGAKNQETGQDVIDAKVASGEFMYHAPLGGDFKIGSEESHTVELKQLYNLGAILAVKLIEESRAA